MFVRVLLHVHMAEAMRVWEGERQGECRGQSLARLDTTEQGSGDGEIIGQKREKNGSSGREAEDSYMNYYHHSKYGGSSCATFLLYPRGLHEEKMKGVGE